MNEGGGEQAESEKECPRAQVYLGDEDTRNAFGIVSLGVGRSKQLLTFPLFEAVQEGWIQDVLQHL